MGVTREESKAKKNRGIRKKTLFYQLLLVVSFPSLLCASHLLSPFHPEIIASPTPLFYLKKKGKKREKEVLKLFLNLLDLVERVVVGLHARVVGLFEADDNGVEHGAGLVDRDDLARVVEPVALGAEDLDLSQLLVWESGRREEREGGWG